MTTATRNNKFAAAGALSRLRGFIGQSQLSAIGEGCHSEEQQHFFDVLCEYSQRVSGMPKTYEQDGLGDKAIVYLHYFKNGCDWYITERDVDTDGEGQVQAFGLANLGFGAEWGYINIQELIDNDVELDLYFKPRPLAEIRERS